tara:strand:- start:2627 stop:2947 length:321 start_codon:yes stop_codon:yes gene_type:complete
MNITGRTGDQSGPQIAGDQSPYLNQSVVDGFGYTVDEITSLHWSQEFHSGRTRCQPALTPRLNNRPNHVCMHSYPSDQGGIEPGGLTTIVGMNRVIRMLREVPGLH